jgi:aspartyl-tRNA(Asn)/glutamyl-tRNA(Gln) amidotransferase subunit C
MHKDVNPEITRKIARLSKLRLSDDEIERFTGELAKILDFVEQLKEVNVNGVEPAIHGIPLTEHFREDQAISLPEEETKRIVACSDQAMYDQFRVPQVIGGE